MKQQLLAAQLAPCSTLSLPNFGCQPMQTDDLLKVLDDFLDNGEFLEIVLESIYRNFLREGELAIDGGANRGRHTMPMAHCVGDSGKVLAREAIPNLAIALRSATESSPVEVFTRALSFEEGHVKFAYCTDRDWRSGIHARAFISSMNTEIIEVDAVTIDGLVEGQQKQVSFIKLDLEGGEFGALKGARKTLDKDRPLVVLEHGGVEGAKLYGYTNEEYFHYLADCGYVVFDLLGRQMTLEEFKHPKIWYFMLLDMQNERHFALTRIFPALLISATREMMQKSSRPSITG